jgi:hypothetical protein
MRTTVPLGLIAALGLGAPVVARGDGDASALFPVVVYDAAKGAGKAPRGQGADVTVGDAAGKAAAQVALPSGGSWGRVWWSGVPKDVRPFAHLDLHLRQTGGEPSAFDVSLSDGGDRSAVLKVAAPKEAWETRRLDLGDLNPEPGFDPANVTSLTLTWKKPAGLGVAVASATLVPGAGGWRHTPEEQMKRIFGARARDVRRESTAHFEVFSDSPKAVSALGPLLEKDAEAIAFHLGAAKEALQGFKLPVYAFKQASDYQEYCVRVLGMTEQLARSTTATGTSWALVLVAQSGGNPAWRHRLARAITAHLYGSGGGAWLHDGAGELCVRRLEDRPVSREMAGRIKAGTHWTLAQLMGAARLHTGADQTDASYDHRPVYLHAASVVEYLLRVPPAEPAAQAPAERVQTRLRGLGAMTEQGRARLDALPRELGYATLDELEAAWKAWVPTAGK